MTQAIVPKELLTATLGGLSLLVVSGGSTGNVLVRQSDGTYAPAAITTGDVVGPSSATDNAIARFDATTGKLLQNCVVTIGDTGNIAGLGTVACGAITSTGASSISQNSSSPSLALSNTTGLGLRITDGTYTAGLIAFTSGSADALIVRNSTNTGNGNFEASKGTFSTLRSIGTVTIEGAINANANSLTVGAITSSGLFCAGTYTVATLPSAAANSYKEANVSDALAPVMGSTVSGGGSVKTKVRSNGINWTVCGI